MEELGRGRGNFLWKAFPSPKPHPILFKDFQGSTVAGGRLVRLALGIRLLALTVERQLLFGRMLF